MGIQEELNKWANEYVPQFNKLSAKYKTHYYTQSPIDCINEEIELMIIGINPKGNLNNGERSLTVNEFIMGNPFWGDRFTNGMVDSAWKFVQGVRFFLGYDNYCHPESIDNDKKTVWTNLSPFESKSGSSDLRKELMQDGIKATLDLIKILRPKQIVLLGINAFQKIADTVGRDEDIIEFSKVFSNIKSQVGRIYNIPTVCLPHPSGQWEVSNKFIPMFVFLHNLAEITNKKGEIKPLKDVVKIMQTEMQLWQERVTL